jgi:hypothetical protein
MYKPIALWLLCCLVACPGIFAQPTDEKHLTDRLETLRLQLIKPDKATLENLTADELTYGHSTGLIEDKATFVDDMLTGKTMLTVVNITNQTIKIIGNVAWVRQHLTGETNHNSIVAKVDIIVLLVWQKQQGEWKLLARQAAKIPQPVAAN